jgi:hypothetical protein
LRAIRQIGSSLMVPAIGKGREEQEMRLVEIVGRSTPRCVDLANMISPTPVRIRLGESVAASSRQRVSGKGSGQCSGCDAPRLERPGTEKGREYVGASELS